MYKTIDNQKLILASGSPRRKELLSSLGIEYQIQVSDVDESLLQAESAAAMVVRLANLKALTIANAKPEAWVLAADTTVEINNQILGKPEDSADARRMLSTLSGQTHKVYTAHCLVNLSQNVQESFIGESQVEFFKLSSGQIEAYIASREPYDKAGAYAVQGLGAHLIKQVSGSYTNVVGLDIGRVLLLLLKNKVVTSVASDLPV